MESTGGKSLFLRPLITCCLLFCVIYGLSLITAVAPWEVWMELMAVCAYFAVFYWFQGLVRVKGVNSRERSEDFL